MECERFKKLLKGWYLQVQDEALAPARMVHFMEAHLAECPVCMLDPEARKDVQKIITLVLPQDKLKVASRSSRKSERGDEVDEDETDDEVEDEDEVLDDDDDDSDDDDDDDTDDDDDDEELEELDELDDSLDI